MTNTKSFAVTELSILSKSFTDPENRPVVEEFTKEILALCEAFGKSGQSGGSAGYVATALSQAIKSLLLQEPICPITGINDEWSNVTQYDANKETLYQNKRCSALFKDDKGCWYLDAIVWKDQKGSCWGGSAILKVPLSDLSVYVEGGPKWMVDKEGMVEFTVQARQFIKEFPFTPKTFYIDVISKEVKSDDWNFYIKDPKQLEKVWKYYQKPLDL
jgi:hypothetical protein